jgi:hypothetical protein
MKRTWGGGMARSSLLPRSDGNLEGVAKTKKTYRENLVNY